MAYRYGSLRPSYDCCHLMTTGRMHAVRDRCSPPVNETGECGHGTETMKQPARMRHGLLNIRQVSEYTGLSVHTLYTMVSQRRIPFVKMARRTMFDQTLLDAWIKQNTVMPIPSRTS